MQKPTRAEFVQQVEKHLTQRGYIDHSLRDCFEAGEAVANEVAAAFDRLKEIIESGQDYETGISSLASKLEKALPIIAVIYEKHSRFYKTVEDMAKDLRQISKNNSLELRDYFPGQKGQRSEFLAQRIAARREFEAEASRRKLDRPILGTSSNSDMMATQSYLAYSTLEDDTHFTQRTSNMDMSSSFESSSSSSRHSDDHSSSSYDSSSSSSFDSGSFNGF